MRKSPLAVGAFLLLATCLQGQHRTLDGCDTWTGSVISVDDQTRQITLEAITGSDTQTFTGVLKKGLRVKRRDGSETELKMSEISVGSFKDAFYTQKTRKVAGKKEKFYEIYRLEPVYIMH